jgi:hypothetical protein
MNQLLRSVKHCYKFFINAIRITSHSFAFVWLCPVFFFFTTLSATAQGSKTSDSLQLIRLYEATDGINWTNKWDLSQPMTTWFGVKLDENGCVTDINLSENNLIGNLPNLDLPNLQNLFLSKNQLRGNIPNFNLPNLVQLGLFANQLWGDIPNFTLPNLQYLDLPNNHLSGRIPNFNLPNLQFLYLYANQLSGSIPDFDLPNLQRLALDNNQLSGDIPNFKLPDLKSLTLYNNQLSGNIPNFTLPNLHYLYLHTNLLSGNISNFILPNLRILDFHANQLSGNIPNFNLTKLHYINLHTNQLSGKIPSFNLPTLQYLILNTNQLSGCIPKNIKTSCPLITAMGGNIATNPSLATQNWENYWNNGEGECPPSVFNEFVTHKKNPLLLPTLTKEIDANTFFIAEAGMYDMTITDVLGQTISRQKTFFDKGENKYILPILQIPKGLFWVKIAQAEQTILTKLILF